MTPRRQSPTWALPGWLVIGLLAVLLGAGGRAPQARAAAWVPRTGVSAGAQATIVALQVEHPRALARYLAGLYRPGSSTFHRFLTPEAFSARFGASPAEVRAVQTRLASLGLAGRVAPDRLYLTVPVAVRQARRSAPDLARALGGPEAGVAAVIAPDQQPTPVPLFRAGTRGSAARAVVSAHAALPEGVSGGAGPCPRAVAAGGVTAPQLAAGYDFNGLYAAGLHGEGMTAAVLEYSDYHDANVTTFERCFGLHVPVRRVLLQGGAGSVAGPAETEVTLDLDVLAEMAPALSRIDVLEAPNTGTGELAAYAGFVTQDRDPVLSVSWGECEEGASQSYQRLLGAITEQAAAQGQQIFVATGDVGSRACAGSSLPTGASVSADTEAALPWVTGVGGTDLSQASTQPGATVHREAVWNDGLGAGGGGQSVSFTAPSWQASYLAASGVKPPGARDICGAPLGGRCRMVPDISMNADAEEGGADPGDWNVPAGPTPAQFSAQGDRGSPGYTVFCHTTNCTLSRSGYGRVGGTSAATPLAAAAAVLDDQAAARAGVSLGFLNPSLYAIASQPAAYGRDFHDVIGGSNDATFTQLACLAACARLYPAGVGYDMATGLGSIDVAKLAADLLTQAGAVTLTPSRETVYGDTGHGPSTTAPVSVTAPRHAGADSSYAAHSDASWLKVRPAGRAPGTLRWHVDPAGLAPGRYSGTITVTAANGSTATLTVAYRVGAPARIRLLTRSLHFYESPVRPLDAHRTRLCLPLWGDELESHGTLPGAAGVSVPGDEAAATRRVLRFVNAGRKGSRLHWALDQTRVAWIGNDLDPHHHPRGVQIRPGQPLVPSVGALARGARAGVPLASLANANAVGGYPPLTPGTYRARLILRDLADPADTVTVPVTLTLGDGRHTPTIVSSAHGIAVRLAAGRSRTLAVTLTDPGARCGYGYSAGADSDWLISAASTRVGAVGPGAHRRIRFRLHVPARTPAGTYHLAIVVASLNAAVAQRRIPVTVRVP